MMQAGSLNVLVAALLAAAIAGCAAAGGSGAAADGASTVAASSLCNPGEISVCSVRTPHRVSDGRYGFHGNTRKRCVCQAESELESLEKSQLPTDQR